MRLSHRLGAQLQAGHARTIEQLEYDSRVDAAMVLAPAAVLVPITDRADPGLILTQRSAALRKHAGQVAFPGGRVDDVDADEVAAALREAREEIGLDADHVEIIGTSDRYHTFTGFDIVPVLGVIPPDLPLIPCEDEVEAIFEVPLEFALDPRNRQKRSIMWEGVERQYYEIMWGERRIWGVTAAILANLSRRLGYDDAA